MFLHALPKMTSPVTKAMIESYALMVMVMGTFFVYFCGMVWAFCNPKLSESEEECGTGDRTDGSEHRWPSAPSSPQRDIRCACAHPAVPPHIAETLTETTYVNFWDDNDSLLSDCAASSRDDYGITNQIAESSSWTA